MFSGVFDGLGHTVSGVTIDTRNYANAVYTGLFGMNAGTVRNVGYRFNLHEEETEMRPQAMRN